MATTTLKSIEELDRFFACLLNQCAHDPTEHFWRDPKDFAKGPVFWTLHDEYDWPGENDPSLFATLKTLDLKAPDKVKIECWPSLFPKTIVIRPQGAPRNKRILLCEKRLPFSLEVLGTYIRMLHAEGKPLTFDSNGWTETWKITDFVPSPGQVGRTCCCTKKRKFGCLCKMGLVHECGAQRDISSLPTVEEALDLSSSLKFQVREVSGRLLMTSSRAEGGGSARVVLRCETRSQANTKESKGSLEASAVPIPLADRAHLLAELHCWRDSRTTSLFHGDFEYSQRLAIFPWVSETNFDLGSKVWTYSGSTWAPLERYAPSPYPLLAYLEGFPEQELEIQVAVEPDFAVTFKVRPKAEPERDWAVLRRGIKKCRLHDIGVSLLRQMRAGLPLYTFLDGWRETWEVRSFSPSRGDPGIPYGRGDRTGNVKPLDELSMAICEHDRGHSFSKCLSQIVIGCWWLGHPELQAKIVLCRAEAQRIGVVE